MTRKDMISGIYDILTGQDFNDFYEDRDYDGFVHHIEGGTEDSPTKEDIYKLIDRLFNRILPNEF